MLKFKKNVKHTTRYANPLFLYLKFLAFLSVEIRIKSKLNMQNFINNLTSRQIITKIKSHFENDFCIQTSQQ